MTPVRIIVVDDDRRVRSLIRRALEPEGFEVDEAADEAELDACMAERGYDLITLDLNLPGTDGLEIARRLRRTTDTPIIMVTGKGDVIDRVVGLEVGADDYLAKPFHIRELLARVRTVLRRSQQRSEPAVPPEAPPPAPAPAEAAFAIGELKLLPDERLLLDAEGVPITLTRGEFDILAALVRANGRVLTREALIDARGEEADAFDRAVDSTIARLRKKLPSGLIGTVREVGYKLAVPVRQDGPAG